MTIRGIEFDFNPLNAAHIERVKAAEQMAARKKEELDASGYSDMGDIIRSQCIQLRTFLDGCLGEGASEKLGLDNDDLEAISLVMEEFNRQNIEAQKRLASVPGAISGMRVSKRKHHGKKRR